MTKLTIMVINLFLIFFIGLQSGPACNGNKVASSEFAFFDSEAAVPNFKIINLTKNANREMSHYTEFYQIQIESDLRFEDPKDNLKPGDEVAVIDYDYSSGGDKRSVTHFFPGKIIGFLTDSNTEYVFMDVPFNSWEFLESNLTEEKKFLVEKRYVAGTLDNIIKFDRFSTDSVTKGGLSESNPFSLNEEVLLEYWFVEDPAKMNNETHTMYIGTVFVTGSLNITNWLGIDGAFGTFIYSNKINKEIFIGATDCLNCQGPDEKRYTADEYFFPLLSKKTSNMLMETVRVNGSVTFTDYVITNGTSRTGVVKNIFANNNYIIEISDDATGIDLYCDYISSPVESISCNKQDKPLYLKQTQSEN